MKSFRNKKVNKKIELLKIYFFLILFLIIIIFLFGKNLDSFLKFNYLRNEKIQIEKKIDLSQIEIEKIENNLEKLNSTLGRDEIILEKFSQQRPGEKVIKILE